MTGWEFTLIAVVVVMAAVAAAALADRRRADDGRTALLTANAQLQARNDRLIHDLDDERRQHRSEREEAFRRHAAALNKQQAADHARTAKVVRERDQLRRLLIATLVSATPGDVRIESDTLEATRRDRLFMKRDGLTGTVELSVADGSATENEERFL